jgi:uridine kinase
MHDQARRTGGTIWFTGLSGSGKTTVARAIYDQLGLDATFLDQDAYYQDLQHLSLEARTRVNFDHPDAFDTDLLVAHIEALRAGRSIDKPTYDFAQHTRAARTIRLDAREIILVDGILLFAEARLRPLFDIKLFVDVADDIRFIRRLQRDVTERGRTVEGVIRQYLDTVRPMHLEFVEPSKRYADVILPEGGHNQVGIDMVLARVMMELARRRAG